MSICPVQNVNCERNKERTGRVLALFLWERDVPGGRRPGFWLDSSLARPLRGCDPLSLAEPLASAICYSVGSCWAGLRNTLYVTESGEYHAKNEQNRKTTVHYPQIDSNQTQTPPSINLTFLDSFNNCLSAMSLFLTSFNPYNC